MIKELRHKNSEVAHDIRTVFRASYAIEAKLLNAKDFPPLKRPLEAFMDSNNSFYGYFKNGELAGAVEIHHNEEQTHIQSLVVHPRFFRQGIGGKLIQFVFDTYSSDLFMVETGVDNGPACLLYKKFGFKEVKQWDTDHGIRKIRFLYSTSSN